MPKEDYPKLLNCPFCGGEARLIKESYSMWSGIPHDFAVVCKNCHASIRQFFTTEAEAIEAWNRRADNDTDKKAR